MDSFVLTLQELTFVKAAVRFWQDENGADSELLQFYSGVPDRITLTSIDVADVHTKLQRVGLRYLICRQPDLLPTTDRVYDSAVLASEDANGQDEIVATVFVTDL